ncbi:protein obstructor-E [Stomoxys calcitrans]|uniref:protein obstructor-E n=1 Tax=Stomoxys calcitrans TaxID=35570 RepID=UPI0027E3A62B|nr:protein obstructor-E [Stomoxys calcitrans]
MTNTLPLLAICFVCLMGRLVNSETFDECEGADDGTYVSSFGSCSAFIYCDGDESVLDDCGNGFFFNGEECDYEENVQCALDEIDNEGGNGEEEPEEPEGEPEETPDEQTSKATPAPSTAATLPAEQPATGEIVDVPPIVRDSCPFSDDPNQIVLITNSNSCSDYYVCYHGNAIGMHCMDHLHFNTATGKCDFPENAKCKLANQAPSEFNKCLPHMSEFFPHPNKCNYFYYCIKGYQTLQQCPFYYGWDIERRTCVHMSQAKCYNGNA